MTPSDWLTWGVDATPATLWVSSPPGVRHFLLVRPQPQRGAAPDPVTLS